MTTPGDLRGTEASGQVRIAGLHHVGPIGHEIGPRSSPGAVSLVAGTGFQPATSGSQPRGIGLSRELVLTAPSCLRRPSNRRRCSFARPVCPAARRGSVDRLGSGIHHRARRPGRPAQSASRHRGRRQDGRRRGRRRPYDAPLFRRTCSRQACTSRRWPICSGIRRSRSPATSTDTPATTRHARRSTASRDGSGCEFPMRRRF